ncbi:MAG: hypothetical protein GF411_12775 [Candidatus Lokiarchaeota archaeon]|nr:hypothetical protein [Candidatus Lokiarchaeota archaeon]
MSIEPRPGIIRKKEIEPNTIELLDAEELLTLLVSYIVNLSQPRRDFSRVAIISIAGMIGCAIIVIFLVSFIGFPILDSIFLLSVLLGIGIPIVLVLVLILPRILFPHPDLITYELRPNLLEVLEKIKSHCGSSEENILLQERIERLREKN